jgi:hypothetical protein
MTDFYPVLVRAVSNLSINSHQARQEIYDHARKFLITQLTAQEPRASAPEIMREQIALESAIRRAEVQPQSSEPRAPNGPEPPLANSADLPSPRTLRRPSVADCEWPDVHFDRRGGQRQISDWPRPASQSELSEKDVAPPPATTVIEHIPEIPDHRPVKLINGSNAKIAPRDLTQPRSEVSAGRTVKTTKNFKNFSVGEEIFESKRFALFDPNIIGLAAIAVMLTFIAVISIPLATIYFSRLVWFFEHLIAM